MREIYHEFCLLCLEVRKFKIQLLLSLALTAKCLSSLKAVTWSELNPMRVLTIVFASLSAMLDLILAASMIYLLNRSKTGLPKTNALLIRFIVLTLSTGLLSAMVSVAQIILVGCILYLFRYVILKTDVRFVSPHIPSYILDFTLSGPNVGSLSLITWKLGRNSAFSLNSLS